MEENKRTPILFKSNTSKSYVRYYSLIVVLIAFALGFFLYELLGRELTLTILLFPLILFISLIICIIVLLRYYYRPDLEISVKRIAFSGKTKSLLNHEQVEISTNSVKHIEQDGFDIKIITHESATTIPRIDTLGNLKKIIGIFQNLGLRIIDIED